MGNRRGAQSSLSAWNYGVRCDGNTLSGAGLISALYDAASQGYLRVELPGMDMLAEHQVIVLERTVPIPSNVELWGPPGLIVRAAPTLTLPMFESEPGAQSAIRLVGGWTIDGNRAGGANVLGLFLQNLADCEIDGVTIQNCEVGGMLLSGCERIRVAGRFYSNGGYGARLSSSNDCNFVGSDTRNNSQASAGVNSGFELGGSSSHNTFAACRGVDDQTTKTQAYGWAEDTSVEGFTGDYNTFAASDFTPNLTGNVRVEGANSGSTTTGSFSGATLANPTISGSPSTTSGEMGISSGKLTVGDGSNSHTLADLDSTETMSGKTLTSPTINGHIKSSGTSPTLSANNGAGTSPPSPAFVVPSMTATDSAGLVAFGTGTSPTTGNLVEVAFAAAYLYAPAVIVCPLNAATAALGLYAVVSGTGAAFNVGCTTTPAASQGVGTYEFAYLVIG